MPKKRIKAIKAAYFDVREKKQHIGRKTTVPDDVPIEETIAAMLSAPSSLRPGWWSIALSLNLLFAIAFAVPSKGRSTTTAQPDKLADLVKKRMVIADYPTARIDPAYCQTKLTSDIKDTFTFFPHRQQAIVRTLKDPQFKLGCTTREIAKKTSDVNSSPAVFMASLKSIYVWVDEPTLPWMPRQDAGVYNHEFMHSEDFLIHSSGVCYDQEEIQRLAPVVKYSAESIQEAHANFDLGDKRIAKFTRLLNREAKGQPLSLSEQEQLNQYKAGCQDCFIANNTAHLPTAQYKQIVAAGWKKGNSKIQYNLAGKIAMEIVDIYNVDSSTPIAILRPANVIQCVLLIPTVIKARLEDIYKSEHPAIRLAERSVHTFQFFSKKGIDTFYPEAYKARQQYLQECSESEIAGSKPKLEL